MLDTNAASLMIREPTIATRPLLRSVGYSDLCLSAVSEAELLFGIERRPQASKLGRLVRSFLEHADILAWDSAAARAYAELRTRLEAAGRPLGTLDMMIAAHALSAGATLVSNDGALKRIGDLLPVVDWSVP